MWPNSWRLLLACFEAASNCRSRHLQKLSKQRGGASTSNRSLDWPHKCNITQHNHAQDNLGTLYTHGASHAIRWCCMVPSKRPKGTDTATTAASDTGQPPVYSGDMLCCTTSKLATHHTCCSAVRVPCDPSIGQQKTSFRLNFLILLSLTAGTVQLAAACC
jgi:hypothetical protein